MSKTGKKQNMLFIFIIATTMLFSSVQPMEKNNPCTTILQLPRDCLCEIFQYFAHKYRETRYNSFKPCMFEELPSSYEYTSFTKPTLNLKFVHSEFKKTIEERPCFLTYINDRPCFFHYPFKFDGYFSTANLYNKKNIKQFTSDLISNKPPLSTIANKTLFINKMLFDSKKYVLFLQAQLKKMLPHFKSTKNKLFMLKLYYDGTLLSEIKNCEMIAGTDKFKAKELTFKNTSISNKKLSMFDSVRKLRIDNCEFADSNVVWPKKIEELTLIHLMPPNPEQNLNSETLPDLKTLTLCSFNQLKGNEFTNLTKLLKLETLFCNKLNITKLPKGLKVVQSETRE